MYAIIRTGGKQYRVEAGDTVRIEKITEEAGSEFEVTEILAVGGKATFVGEPTVKEAKVQVVVLKQSKLPKVIVFKKKRRQGYRRLKGHRQLYTEIFVKSITSPDGETAQAEKPTAKKKAAAAPKKKVAKKAAAKKKTSAKKTTTKKKTTKKAGKKTAKKTAKKKVK